MFRIGQGIDFHRFTDNGRPVILGGVLIESRKQVQAHSDGDILIHALMDALLGALALPDIGCLFPDTDQEFENIRSVLLLEKVMKKVHERGYSINNLDITLIAETPKIKPYREEILKNLSKILDIPLDRIGLKATTSEKMGAIGREEGFSCSVVVLLQKKAGSHEKIKQKEEAVSGKIEVYTDGACLGNPGPGGWGVLINLGSGKEIAFSGGEAQTTNNRMEMTAVIQAMQKLLLINQPRAILHTDSNYVMQGITQWIKNWKKNGWKNSQKDPVANADLWKKMDELNQKLSIEYKWVKGHDGNPGNEMCDEMASKEAKSFQETPSLFS